MAKQTLEVKQFYGGLSNDQKVGIPNAFLFARNMDIYQDASYITPNPKTIKVTGSTVVDLPLWGVDGSPFNSFRYFYGDEGHIYSEEDGGPTWLDIHTVTNGGGQGLCVFADYLYYASSRGLGRYGPLSGTPIFNDNFLADGITNLDQNQALTGNTYTPPVSISETSTNRQTFTPTKDPVASISIYVTDKGTGNWTLTLHDIDNNNLGSVTIANANLANGALNNFDFEDLGEAIRVTPNNEYHFHITSTVADGTLRTGTSADLETSTYNEYFGILIAGTQFHSIALLLNGIVICNADYLAFWDNANYNPNQIALESGFESRTLSKENEFIIAGALIGSPPNAEKARLYYWDGISPTFNYSIDASIGMPNALISNDNQTFGIYGEGGSIFVNTSPFQLLQEIPNVTPDTQIEIAPGAISAYQARIALGYSLSTTDETGLYQGVYIYGNKTDQFPNVLSYAYTLSTGTMKGSTLRIGAVMGVGEDLYIGWDDNGTFGIDKVKITNDPFATSEFYTLIFDNDFPQKPKYADILVVKFEPLASGESITPKYAIDANAYSRTFTTGDTISTVGATQAVFPIGKRFNDISFGFNSAQSTTFPKITGLMLLIDDLEGERQW